MARRKPLSELSPAYRKRLESAERRGKSRAEARGHKPRPGKTEYQHRKERERQLYGATGRAAQAARETVRELAASLEGEGLSENDALTLARVMVKYPDEAHIPFTEVLVFEEHGRAWRSFYSRRRTNQRT